MGREVVRVPPNYEHPTTLRGSKMVMDEMPPEERSWSEKEATWYQVWQTVSDGYPVTPPFPTKVGLSQYLAKEGDFWDQERGDGPWGAQRAIAFVNAGWVPSNVVVDGKFMAAKDVALGLRDSIKRQVDACDKAAESNPVAFTKEELLLLGAAITVVIECPSNLSQGHAADGIVGNVLREGGIYRKPPLHNEWEALKEKVINAYKHTSL